MPKLLSAFCAITATLVVASCSGPSAEQKEAEAATKLIFDKLLTRCEDGRVLYAGSDLDMVDGGGYPHPNEELIEFKNTVMTVSAKPLSEADKLNGLNWEGQVTCSLEMCPA